MKRQVVSTSSSGLDYVDVKHNVELIRLRIYVNNVEFIDGKNITDASLRDLMTQTTRPVRTAPAPKTEVIELFERLYEQGTKEIFVTTLSSKVSDSHSIISEVASQFVGRMHIYVYDCKDLNICEAMLALEAEKLMAEGVSMADIAKRLDSIRANHKMLFAVEDLTYLINNKKLSGTAGFFANMLSIKPVLQVNDAGEVLPVNKIRKFDRAAKYIVDELAETLRRPDSFAYILSMGRPTLDNQMQALIQERVGISKPLPVMPVSAISLANHGPTGVALCVCKGEIPHAAKMLNFV